MQLLVGSYDGFADARGSHKSESSYFPTTFPSEQVSKILDSSGNCGRSASRDALSEFRITSMTSALLTALAQSSDVLGASTMTSSTEFPDNAIDSVVRGDDCKQNDHWKWHQELGYPSFPEVPVPTGGLSHEESCSSPFEVASKLEVTEEKAPLDFPNHSEASNQFLREQLFWQTPQKDVVRPSTGSAIVTEAAVPQPEASLASPVGFWANGYNSSDWSSTASVGQLLHNTPPQLTFPRKTLPSCDGLLDRPLWDTSQKNGRTIQAKRARAKIPDVADTDGVEDGTPSSSTVDSNRNGGRVQASKTGPGSAASGKAAPGKSTFASQVMAGRAPNNPQEPFVGPVQTCRKIQYKKTKPCPWNALGKCVMGDRCNYAHTEAELRGRPDLTHTRLCPKGTNCNLRNCRFAHEASQLRATGAFYRTKLCKFWLKGSCPAERRCRHAHGESELRHPDSVPEDRETGAQEIGWTSTPGGGVGPFDTDISRLTTSDTSSVGWSSGLRKSESEATQVSLESNPKSTKQSPPLFGRKSGSDQRRRQMVEEQRVQISHGSVLESPQCHQQQQQQQRRVGLEAPLCSEADVLKHINRGAPACTLRYSAAGDTADLEADCVIARSPPIISLSSPVDLNQRFPSGRFEGGGSGTFGGVSSPLGARNHGIVSRGAHQPCGYRLSSRQQSLRNGAASAKSRECLEAVDPRSARNCSTTADCRDARTDANSRPHALSRRSSGGAVASVPQRKIQNSLLMNSFAARRANASEREVERGAARFYDGRCILTGPGSVDSRSPQWNDLSNSSLDAVPAAGPPCVGEADISLDAEPYINDTRFGAADNTTAVIGTGADYNLKLQDIIQLAVSSQDPDLLECSAKILRASLWLKRKEVE